MDKSKKLNIRPRQSSLMQDVNQYVMPPSSAASNHSGTMTSVSSLQTDNSEKPKLKIEKPPRTSSIRKNSDTFSPVSNASETPLQTSPVKPKGMERKQTSKYSKVPLSERKPTVVKLPASDFSSPEERPPSPERILPNPIESLPLKPPAIEFHDVSPMETPTTSSPMVRNPISVMSDLESKSKADLITIVKKLTSEISLKNRIIHDAKVDEKWLVAEIGMNSRRNPPVLQYRMSELATSVAKMNVPPQDRLIIETLMVMKKELDSAKDSLENSQASLLQLERKRTAAEEEAAYLRTILDPANPNISESQNQRIAELELQLNETLENYTKLQTKISQWARTSKRNQEGRVAAEAIQTVLQEDISNLQKQLEESIQNETMTRLKLENLSDSIKNGNPSKDMSRQLDEITSVESLQVNIKLQQLYDDEVKEKQKYQRLYQTLQRQNQDLIHKISSEKEFAGVIRKPSVDFRNLASGGGSVMVEHELDVVRERLQQLEAEYNQLQETNKGLKYKIHDLESKNATLENTIFENGDLIQRVNHLTSEKKALQKAMDNITFKSQQKQLAIEMLEKHLDSANQKLIPLQQRFEESEDLFYNLEDEKALNAELNNKIQTLLMQSHAYQEKIMELTNQLAAKSSETSKEAQPSTSQMLLEEELKVAQTMNEMLKLQIEEKTQDIKVLETKLGAQAVNGATRNMMTVQKRAEPCAESEIKAEEARRELNSLHRELEEATGTLAEQTVTINKLEVLLGGTYEKIEALETEKARLVQKLAVMQRIKSDFDAQTAKCEQLEAKLAELEKNGGNNGLSAQFEEDHQMAQDELIRILGQLNQMFGLNLPKTIPTTDGYDFRNELSEMNYIVGEVEKIMHSNYDQIRWLETEVDDLKEKVGKSTEANSKHESIGSKSEYMPEEMEQLRKQIHQTEIENEKVFQELEQSRARTKKLEMAIVEYQNAIKLFQADLADMEEDRERLALREKQLSQENAHLNKLKTEINSIHESYQRNEAQLQQEINELRHKVGAAGDENGKNNQEYYKEEYAKLYQENEKLMEKINALEQLRAELERSVEYQGGIAEDALQQLDEYEEEILYLRSQQEINQSLKKELEACTEEIYQLRGQLAQKR